MQSQYQLKECISHFTVDELETEKLHYDYVVDSQYSLITASQMYEAPGPDLSSEPEYQYATIEATTPSRLNQVTIIIRHCFYGILCTQHIVYFSLTCSDVWWLCIQHLLF